MEINQPMHMRLNIEVMQYQFPFLNSLLKTEKLYTAINTILTNSSFTEKAKEHGQLVMDQMNTPLDTAVCWLEYVLRHPGMKHMRSPVHDLNWPQYFLLDVIAAIAFIIVSIFAIILFLLKC